MGLGGGQPMPGLPGGRPQPPPGIPGLPEAQSGNTPPPSVVTDSFLTVDPSLKRIFDNLDYQRKALVFAATEKWANALRQKEGVSRVLQELDLPEQLKDKDREKTLRAIGLALRELSQDRVAIYAATETRRPAEAVLLERILRFLAAQTLPQIEKDHNFKIALGGGVPNQGMFGNQGGEGMMGAEGGMGMMGVPTMPPGQGFMGGTAPQARATWVGPFLGARATWVGPGLSHRVRVTWAAPEPSRVRASWVASQASNSQAKPRNRPPSSICESTIRCLSSRSTSV